MTPELYLVKSPTGWWQLKDFLFAPQTLGKWSNLTNIFFRWVGEKPPTIVHIYSHNFSWEIPDRNSHQNIPPSMRFSCESRHGIRAFWVLWIWSVLWFLVRFVSPGLMWLDGRRRLFKLNGARFLGVEWSWVWWNGLGGGLLQSFGLEDLKNLFFLIRQHRVFINTSFNKRLWRNASIFMVYYFVDALPKAPT